MDKSLSKLSELKEESSRHLKLFISENIEFSRRLLEFIRKIIRIMSSSSGRDKICGIVQYISKIFALTAISSNIENLRKSFNKKEMKIHLTAYRIWKALSQARKIFRFLKFIEVIEDIVVLAEKLNENESWSFRLNLILMAKISSFFYFMLDNIVWFIHSDILKFPKKRYFRLTNKKKIYFYKKHLFFHSRLFFSFYQHFRS
jgi:hypothetical protein